MLGTLPATATVIGHSVTVSCCHSATKLWSQCHNVMVPQCHSATVLQCHGATVSQCRSDTVMVTYIPCAFPNGYVTIGILVDAASRILQQL